MSSAYHMLFNLLKDNPDLEDLNLGHCNLRSLDEEMKIMVQFHNLRHLDLSGNQLSALPHSMSELKKLLALNISNNDFHSTMKVTLVLQQLPSLKSLSISLPTTHELELLVAHLPNLRILNGQPMGLSDQEALLSSFGKLGDVPDKAPYVFHQRIASPRRTQRGAPLSTTTYQSPLLQKYFPKVSSTGSG